MAEKKSLRENYRWIYLFMLLPAPPHAEVHFEELMIDPVFALAALPKYAALHTEARSFLIMLICGNCLVVTCLLAITLEAFFKYILETQNGRFQSRVCMDAMITERDLCFSLTAAAAATLGSGLSHVCVLKEACPQDHLFLRPQVTVAAPVFGLGCRWLQVESRSCLGNAWCSSRCSPAPLGRR